MDHHAAVGLHIGGFRWGIEVLHAIELFNNNNNNMKSL
jgi:hypothetical protein